MIGGNLSLDNAVLSRAGVGGGEDLVDDPGLMGGKLGGLRDLLLPVGWKALG